MYVGFVTRTAAPYFISYAREDRKLVDDLIARLDPHLAGSKRYAFEKRTDTDLLPGTRWREVLIKELERHRIALLLLSPTFLVQPFIVGEALPRLVIPGKLVLPVLLKPVDLERQELHGLEDLHIFTMWGKDRQRAFSEFAGVRRDAFALELYRAIEDRLDRDYR